ncbi:hypothetical protein D9V34_12200 [Mycetocola lacteus]|uniref:Uncharacterized protein n=1 Tax=Mycetocola lacteus TaxID=76637 RepID=A0A3L7ALR3_9MICO|nr:hypothetical protein [Mycetocola lacteus]RLP81379.1 hypothetical protein D9V34_12200 [Mycetocola lacteus]
MADHGQDSEDQTPENDSENTSGSKPERTPDVRRTPPWGRDGERRRPGNGEDVRRDLRRMMQQADAAVPGDRESGTHEPGAHEFGDRRRGRREGGPWAPGNERRGFADLRFTRGVFALSDQGCSVQEIADRLEVPVEEITRRLARRELYRGSVDLRDIVLDRQSGTISTEEMIRRLSALSLTAHTPGTRGAYDGAASATGTARQLMAVLRDGLITEAEYEAVRQAAARRRAR